MVARKRPKVSEKQKTNQKLLYLICKANYCSNTVVPLRTSHSMVKKHKCLVSEKNGNLIEAALPYLQCQLLYKYFVWFYSSCCQKSTALGPLSIRSSRYHLDGERPAHIHYYLQLPTALHAVLLVLFGAVFGLLASFGAGRRLLERYPEVFSLGKVSRRGPSTEMMEGTRFQLTLVGHGWRRGSGAPEGRLDRRVVATVRGRNMGYGATCECMVQAALVILQGSEGLPEGRAILCSNIGRK